MPNPQGEWSSQRLTSGFLNIRKAPGETSHSVVARLRRATGERRVGHAGTLDPSAVGVLPIAVGNATRLTMASGWTVKTYWADVRFGSATTTDDAEGRVIETGPTESVTAQDVLRILPDFLGVTFQEPPTYSAVHVEGERSYHRARQGNPIRPRPREVRIDAIRLVGCRLPVVSVLVQCGSGTYIRSLARDLGRRLGCPAHLAALVRVRVGPFELAQSVSIEALQETGGDGGWQRFLWPSDVAVEDLTALVVDEATEQDFRHGRQWAAGERPARTRVRLYSQTGQFLGLAECESDRWQPVVVLEADA